MIIKDEKKILKGEHAGTTFMLEDGIICVNGGTFAKNDIKYLVDLATLLQMHGYEITETKPKEKKLGYCGRHLWAYTGCSDCYPTEEDDEDEK